MKVFGLIGWSGSGKTTLMVRLLPELTRRGYTVSTMKHTHHRFDVDRPGKDSYEHRHAGAKEVMVVSSKRWALMNEYRDDPEPDVDDVIARMAPVDLLLIEGFKNHDHPKLEVHRPSLGKPSIQRDDPGVVAIAADEKMPDATARLLDINDPAAIADFIIAHCQMDEVPAAQKDEPYG